VRVYELAREFRLSSKEIVEILINEGLSVRNHMSRVRGEEEGHAREILSQYVFPLVQDAELGIPSCEDVLDPEQEPPTQPSDFHLDIARYLDDWLEYLDVRKELAIKQEVFSVWYENVGDGPSEEIVDFRLAQGQAGRGEWEKIERARECRIYLKRDNYAFLMEDVLGGWWIGNKYEFDKSTGILRVIIRAGQGHSIEEVKRQIPRTGILYNDAYGTEQEVKRQQQGLISLKEGTGRNERLLELLFDPSGTRSPGAGEISLIELKKDLLIPNLNRRQLHAVRGALNCNDIYFIKGPPGTGKTTVIAELCYQFAKRGRRVLISSQANLAVDNALGKLVHHRLIKPIRIGNDENIEEEGKTFIESRVIPEWLKRTVEACGSSWENRRERLKEADKILLVKDKLDSYLRISKEYEEAEAEFQAYMKEAKQRAERLKQEERSIEQELYKLKEEMRGLIQVKGFVEKGLKPSRRWEKVPVDLLSGWLRQELKSFLEKFREIKKGLYDLTLGSKENKHLHPLLTIKSFHPAHLSRKAFLLSYYAETCLLHNYSPRWVLLKRIKDTLEQLSKARADALVIERKKKAFEDRLSRAKLGQAEMSKKCKSIEEQISCLNSFLNNRAEFFSSVISGWVENTINESWNVLSTNPTGDHSISRKPFPSYHDEWPPVRLVLGRIEKLLKTRIEKWERESRAVWEQQDDYKELLHFKNLCEEKKRKFCDALGKTQVNSLEPVPEDDPWIKAIITSRDNNKILIHKGYEEKIVSLFERYWRGTSAEKLVKSFYELVGSDSWDNKEKERWRRGYAYFLTLTKVIDRYWPGIQRQHEELFASAVRESVKIREEAKKIVEEQIGRHIRNLENELEALKNRLLRLGNEEKIVYEQKQRNQEETAWISKKIDSLINEAKALVLGIRKAGNPLGCHKLIKIAEECISGAPFGREAWEDAAGSTEDAFARLREHRVLFDLLVSALAKTIEKAMSAEQDALNKIAEINRRITELVAEVNRNRDRIAGLEDTRDASEMQWEETAGKHGDLIKKIHEEWDKEGKKATDKEYLKALLKAIDNVCLELPKLRVFMDSYESIAMEWLERIKRPSEKDIADLKDIYIQAANVVGATCSISGSARFREKHSNFDVVIVDEISKATLPELVLPCLAGEKIILIGDDKQLPPMIGPETITELADRLGTPAEKLRHLEQSFFARLWKAAPERQKSMLNIQYRMHPDIMEAINQFYGDALECGIPEPDEALKHGCGGELVTEDHHLLWISTPKGGKFGEMKESKTFYNEGELEITERVLERLHEAWAKNSDGRIKKVGIITFYSAQAKKLKKMLSDQATNHPLFDFRIGTVDRFQGMEREIVLVSMVRNNDVRNIGFAKEPERINVAFSRAKELLVIIGCASLFCWEARDCAAKSIYRKVAETVRRKGRFSKDVSKLLNN